MERKEKEMKLRKEFAKAKKIFDSDPNDNIANALNSAKEKLELLYEENFKVLLFAQERVGGNMVKRVQNIFLIWRKETKTFLPRIIHKQEQECR